MFASRIYRIYSNDFLSSLRRFCSKVNSFTWRSHSCGELREKHEGLEVTLCGWITYQRYNKFVVLKDAYGATQILFEEHDLSTRNFMFSLPIESVVQIKGIVHKRPRNKGTQRMSTGSIEVVAKEVKLLNTSIPNLPFTSRTYEKVQEAVKQKYRYISLRHPRSQEILRTRSQFIMKMRDFLHNHHGFVEVETPTLFRRTPGGAKEFIVPTKYPGKCYTLVQSPQQFKQLLMVGAIDRYFQICRCYRNEGTKSDRQPEFTQVDIEASFTTGESIRKLVEQMLSHSWPEERHILQTPFPCMTYDTAMKLYGTDKPDTRYEILIHNLNSCLAGQNIEIFDRALNEQNGIIGAISFPVGAKFIKGSVLDEMKDKAQEFGLQNLIDIRIKKDLTWDSFLSKHLSEDAKSTVNQILKVKPNDMILIAAGPEEKVNTVLGKIRVQGAEVLQSAGVEVFKADSLSFVWIVDFPLFVKNEEGTVESAHHPFTAPCSEHIDLVYTDPLKASGQHYDLVLNGQEVGGGSIRIHDPLLQKYILDEVLKEDSSSLQHLLDGLASGCPPHGGIALGVDRLMSIMFGCHSIAEVIAFPKSMEGKDLMSGAPASISEEDKRLYHIEPKLPNS